jgi:2,3-diketo-5-methylthio-1-phosphopentane phosphatase
MIEIFCDFDGTLTDRDTLVVLLDRYAQSDWYAVEERMLRGEIEEKEGLRAELALLKVSDEELMATLDEEIRPAVGLENLVTFLRGMNWPMTVLSGGLIRFSGALWRNWGYGEIPLYANDHRRDAEGGIEVIPAEFPHIRDHCNHCKRWHVEEAVKRGAKTVYIGDGLTDHCPAEAAQRRYAKGTLLEHLRREGLETVPFETLSDVVEDLKRNPL